MLTTIILLASLIFLSSAQNLAKNRPVFASSVELGSAVENAVDGICIPRPLLGYCFTSTSEANAWLYVELAEVSHVRTIAFKTDETTNVAYDKIRGSTLRVGNSTTITDNPSCGHTINDAGYHDCDLWGKYVGIHRSTANQLIICELSVYADKNIAPIGTAT